MWHVTRQGKAKVARESLRERTRDSRDGTRVLRFSMITRFVFPMLLVFATAARSADEPFLSAPEHVGPPKPGHAATNRAFQGIPSMAAAPGGRLWAIWYAGITPGEDQNNYVVV